MALIGREALLSQRYRVTRTPKDLERLISRGEADARKLTHARVLRQAGEAAGGLGWIDRDIATALQVSVRRIERVRQRLVERGLAAALLPKAPPRIHARKLDGEQEARLLTVPCGRPPDGKRRWALRRLAERRVELGCVDTLSYETVRQTLNKRAPAASAQDVVPPTPAIGRVR